MLIPTIEPKTVQYFCRTLQYRDDLAMASALLEFEVEKKAKVIGYKKIHREDGTPIDMAIYEAAQ